MCKFGGAGTEENKEQKIKSIHGSINTQPQSSSPQSIPVPTAPGQPAKSLKNNYRPELKSPF